MIQTLRAPTIAGMPLFDWAGSLIAAYLVGRVLHINGWSWVPWLIIWTLFGVLVHYLLGVNTMLGYYLGVNPKPKRMSCIVNA